MPKWLQQILICASLIISTLPTYADTALSSLLQTKPSIALEGVTGKFDHLALDIPTNRLFLTSRGKSAVIVIDLESGKIVHSIEQLNKPAGIVYAPESNLLFVAEAGANWVSVFDGRSYKLIHQEKDLEDADYMISDPANQAVLVGHAGGICVLDAKTGNKTADGKIDGTPESFKVDQTKAKLYINVPGSSQVVVLNRKTLAKLASWSITSGGNTPMVVDPNGRLIYIGCRKPAQLVVIDAKSGKTVSTTPMSGGVDDMFFDASKKRIYASCGEGFLDVFDASQADTCKRVIQVPTGAGAKTCLFEPSLRELFIAVPQQGTQSAEIRVFQAL